MNNIDPPHNHLPPTDWRILGELQLQFNANQDGIINQWLLRTLDPFNLPSDFASKIVKSVEDAAVRVLDRDIVEGKFEYLDIFILAPANQPSKGQTWGFFRLERMDNNTKSTDLKRYRMEYYLYPERTS